MLYCADKGTDFVYEYNFSTSLWTEKFKVPVPAGVPDNRIYPTGITWDGINFWISNSSYEHDYLLQVSPTGTLIQSVSVTNAGNAKPSGIAFTY